MEGEGKKEFKQELLMAPWETILHQIPPGLIAMDARWHSDEIWCSCKKKEDREGRKGYKY